jgi:kynurenine formamidase
VTVRAPLPDEQLEQIAAEVSNWGRWGEADELGTLNFITPRMRIDAAGEVSTGEVVAMARPLNLGTSADLLQSVHAVWRVFEPVEAASEFIGVMFHGPAVTHLDALNHMHQDVRMYNGFSAEELLPKTGSTHLTIDTVTTRVSGRGVLLDVARCLAVDALEPGERITPDDLERTERMASVEVGCGDLLFVRTGANAWHFEGGTPGLDADCVRWLHERQVALLGCDVANDAMPGPAGRWNLPVHQLAMVHMGMPLLDNCDLRAISEACTRNGRASFLAVIAPLRIIGGTGSPVTPLAIF